MKDASPSCTERLDQNHSLGRDHKWLAKFGPLCHEFSINLAETIIWNKGDLKKDVESATHSSPLQAISDRRKRNKRRVKAAPVFWLWGCWRTRWIKWASAHFWGLGTRQPFALKSGFGGRANIKCCMEIKTRACKVVLSASSKPGARSLEPREAGVQVSSLPFLSAFQIPSQPH